VHGSGRSAFVKIATTPLTAAHMHRELRAYGAIDARFRPTLLGFSDDLAEPFLIIEDLSEANWPPAWSDEKIAAALETIRGLHASSARLRPYAEVHAARTPGWAEVARDARCFLSLGLADRAWLDAALPRLIEAEAACSTEGDAVTHFDLRSDNICILDDRAILVDWGEACLSNPKLDLGGWLPSLAYEGGPPPDAVLPNAPEVAAWVSGYFAARAGLPTIPDAPFVRQVQLAQLHASLPWVCRALGLPVPS